MENVTEILNIEHFKLIEDYRCLKSSQRRKPTKNNEDEISSVIRQIDEIQKAIELLKFQ